VFHIGFDLRITVQQKPVLYGEVIFSSFKISSIQSLYYFIETHFHWQ